MIHGHSTSSAKRFVSSPENEVNGKGIFEKNKVLWNEIFKKPSKGLIAWQKFPCSLVAIRFRISNFAQSYFVTFGAIA
jgi:hypothetical protein